MPPVLKSVLLAVLVIDTPPLKVDPLRKIRPVLPFTFAPKVVPLKVDVAIVLSVRAAAPPPLFIVPVVKVLVPVVVRLNPLMLRVPVYPFMVIPATVAATSKVQLPRPSALNVTKSLAPGTEAPPAPPELADQFAVLFQFEGAAEIQNLWAKDSWLIKVKMKRERISRCRFMKYVAITFKNTVYTNHKTIVTCTFFVGILFF